MNWSVLPYLIVGALVFFGVCAVLMSSIDGHYGRKDLARSDAPPKPVPDLDPTKW